MDVPQHKVYADDCMRKLLEQKHLSTEEAFALCQWLGDEMNLEDISGRHLDLPRPFALDAPVDDCLIFFPGSFYPWHLGHRECLLKCPEGPIVIVPDRNPWKDVQSSNPWEDVLLIKEQVMSLDRKDIFIYPGFLAKKEANLTATWLPQVKVKEKWLLMGDDLFLGLHRWHNFKVILCSLKGIYVCPRLGNKVELSIQKESLQNVHPLDIVFLDHHDFEGLSSTDIRASK